MHSRESPRAGLSFIAVNCGGLPETLLESELFGHVRGSFTGAYRDKPGKLELAARRDVFLDEIGEMTLRMQGLLLRFLETGELQKVGADGGGRVVNVRVIAATNRNLRDMIAQGAFREDLFYRLNVIHLDIPPLRERARTCRSLVEHFLQLFTRDAGCVVRTLSAEAMASSAATRGPATCAVGERLERVVITCREADRDGRRPAGRRPRAGRRRIPAEARAAPHGGGRSLQAAHRRTRVLLVLRLHAVHGSRDHARHAARGRSARGWRTRAATTGSSRACSTWKGATTSGS